jgi:hypothetical protein
MKDTLKCKYATLPQIKLRLKKRPIGTIARKYKSRFMGTLWRESRTGVNLAKAWVMAEAKTMCHVVKNMGNSADC